MRGASAGIGPGTIVFIFASESITMKLSQFPSALSARLEYLCGNSYGTI
jgi:hypothetical protein